VTEDELGIASRNLTAGDYQGVIAAAKSGTEMAPIHRVTMQLADQEAKAWARIGDRQQTEGRPV
jgi:hypothetical protein